MDSPQPRIVMNFAIAIVFAVDGDGQGIVYWKNLLFKKRGINDPDNLSSSIN